jgi:hypothetical protein
MNQIRIIKSTKTENADNIYEINDPIVILF